MVAIKKIFCNTCKYETKHDIKSNHERSYYEEVDKYHGQIYYEIFKYNFLICRGCDTATLEEAWRNTGMYDHDGNEIFGYEYSPPRRNLDARRAKTFEYIDKKLNETYIEIITCHQAGLGIVTAMGIRALLEGVCVIEGVDDKKHWALKDKIIQLQNSKKIPEKIIDGLNRIKFIGDDAAHRLIPTDSISINLSIDLLEALLTYLYEAKFDLQSRARLVKEAQKLDNKSDS